MQTISKATVESVRAITDEIYEFKIVPEKYRRFETGQFLQLSMDLVTASDIWPDSRPFSIASTWDKNNKSMRLLVKRNGAFTSKMFSDLKVGSECTVKYSFGDMVFPLEDQDQIIVMIAGGTGIAPFLGVIEAASKQRRENVKLFYSVKTTQEFIDLDELFERIGKENVKLFCTRESSEFYENKRIAIEDVISDINDIQNTNFYICGSQQFISHFKLDLENNGANKIFIDEWE